MALSDISHMTLPGYAVGRYERQYIAPPPPLRLPFFTVFSCLTAFPRLCSRSQARSEPDGDAGFVLVGYGLPAAGEIEPGQIGVGEGPRAGAYDGEGEGHY